MPPHTDTTNPNANVAAPDPYHSLAKMRINGTWDWGPVTWATLHIWAAKKYPLHPTENDRQQAVTLLQTWFPVLIPCGICEHHFRVAMQEAYPHTASSVTLSAFLVETHNKVNRRNGAPTLTLDEAMTHYSRLPQAVNAFTSILAGKPMSEDTLLHIKTQVHDSRAATIAIAVAVVLALALVAAVGYAIYLRRTGASAAVAGSAVTGAAQAYQSLRARPRWVR